MYQYRWVMYCKYTDKPLEWEAHGSNVNFMSWLLGKWREFGIMVGFSENERRMYDKQFDTWLSENVPAENNGEYARGG